MLYIEAQAEQHSEYRIHLARKQEECGVPYCGVDRSPELVLRLREDVEVHVLDEVYEDDAGYGYASEDVSYIYPCIRFG